MIEIIIALTSLVPLGVLIKELIHHQKEISEAKVQIESIKKCQRRSQQALFQVWLPEILKEIEELVLNVLEKDQTPSTLVELHYQRIERIFEKACKIENHQNAN